MGVVNSLPSFLNVMVVINSLPCLPFSMLWLLLTLCLTFLSQCYGCFELFALRSCLNVMGVVNSALPSFLNVMVVIISLPCLPFSMLWLLLTLCLTFLSQCYGCY